MKDTTPPKGAFRCSPLTFLGWGLIGVSLAFVWWQISLLRAPPGVTPIAHVDLHQIQGPWFEVARLDSPLEEGLKYPMLFIKYTGPGADSFYAYSDPSDPRFRLILSGASRDTPRKTAFDVTTDHLDTFETGSIRFACKAFVRCSLHLIDYDEKDHTWMVVTGSNKKQLWIFSRGPGLLPAVLEKINARLSGLGYDVGALIYENMLPKIPEILPPVPEVLPIPPGAKS